MCYMCYLYRFRGQDLSEDILVGREVPDSKSYELNECKFLLAFYTGLHYNNTCVK